MTFDREHWQYAPLPDRGSGRVQRAQVSDHQHDDLYYRRFAQGNSSDYTYSRRLIEDRYYDRSQSNARFAPIVHDHGDTGTFDPDLYYTKIRSDERFAPVQHEPSIHDSGRHADAYAPPHDHPYSLLTHGHSTGSSWFIHDHAHNHDERYYTESQSDNRFARIEHDSEHDDRFARIEHDNAHDDRFSRLDHTHQTDDPGDHNHDDRYYRETESDSRYARTDHDSSHDDRFYTKSISDSRYLRSAHHAASSSDHDDRYYTEIESDARFAPVNHGEHGGEGVDAGLALWTTNPDDSQLTNSNGQSIRYAYYRALELGPINSLSLVGQSTIVADVGRFTDVLSTQFLRTSTGEIIRTFSLQPSIASRWDLGTAGYPWRSIHADNLNTRIIQVSDFENSNVASDSHLHDETGAPMEHNHDDSYYTEAESNARFQLAGSLYITESPTASVVSQRAYIRTRWLGGVSDLEIEADTFRGDLADADEVNTLELLTSRIRPRSGNSFIIDSFAPSNASQVIGSQSTPYGTIYLNNIEGNPDGNLAHINVNSIQVSNFNAGNVSPDNHSHESGGAPENHTHDERYFTESQSDVRYSRLNHNHPISSHNHDERYYTESQSDARYAELSHEHGTGGDHNHDGRYYTRTQINNTFAIISHNHNSDYAAFGHTHENGAGGDNFWSDSSAAEAVTNRIYALSAYAHAPRFIAAERIESPIIQTREISSDLTAGIELTTNLIPDSPGDGFIGTSAVFFREMWARTFQAIRLMETDQLYVADFSGRTNVSSSGHRHDGGGPPVEHDHDEYLTQAEGDARYSLTGHSHQNGGGTPTAHNHDDRYWTENEADNRYALDAHNHDDRYFLEAEIVANYYTRSFTDSNFSRTGHTHQGVGGAELTYGTPVSIGTSNSQGSGNAVARALHIHAHPTGMHEREGSVRIDGDRLDIDYIPSNYSRSTAPSQVSHLQHLTAHLRGIDDQLVEGGGGDGLSEEEVRDLVGRMVTTGIQTGLNIEHDDPNNELDFAVSQSWVRDVVGTMVINNVEERIVVSYNGSQGKLNFEVIETPIPWTAIPSNLRPSITSQYDLGSSAYRWNNAHINDLQAYTRVETPRLRAVNIETDNITPLIASELTINSDVDIVGHLDMSDHVIYGIGQIERTGQDDITLPDSLGGLDTLADVRQNFPLGGLLVGEDTAVFSGLLDSVLNAVFQDIPGVVANFLDGDDHGRIFIRVGSNVYIFHSDSRISLSGV